MLASPAELAARGIELIRVERGGEVTYHGPGQLVAYPILALSRRGLLVRPLVRALEAAMTDTCAAFGVVAGRREGHPGCWCDVDGAAQPRKIGALGLRVERGVSYHGIALNVDPDLADFDLIDPCGMPGVVSTSIAHELDVSAPVGSGSAPVGSGSAPVSWAPASPAPASPVTWAIRSRLEAKGLRLMPVGASRSRARIPRSAAPRIQAVSMPRRASQGFTGRPDGARLAREDGSRSEPAHPTDPPAARTTVDAPRGITEGSRSGGLSTKTAPLGRCPRRAWPGTPFPGARAWNTQLGSSPARARGPPGGGPPRVRRHRTEREGA